MPGMAKLELKLAKKFSENVTNSIIDTVVRYR